MRAAERPIQRHPDARLLVVGPDGALRHAPRARLVDQLTTGDVLVVNDAATIPASLQGTPAGSGGSLEVRLAARSSLSPDDVHHWTAVIFGAGDHRTRTEDRPVPPELRPGDSLRLGPLTARIVAHLGHPRLVELRFSGSVQEIWAGLAQHGRPIQYAHVAEPLALWDVWTPFAGPPAAFEAPSAGFALDWAMRREMEQRGVEIAALTHAAGISSTGDPELDARLPLNEAYDLPRETVAAIGRAQARGGRVVALGTTVTRALEHAAARGLPPGPGMADQRIGPDTRLRVVDAIVSGVHEPGESHYELLAAFAPATVLRSMAGTLEDAGYRNHEFGDSVLVPCLRCPPRRQAPGRRLPAGARRRAAANRSRPSRRKRFAYRMTR